MAKPYSMALGERAVAAVIEERMSCHAAATRFEVAASSATKWVWRVQETGSAAPDRMGGHKPNILSSPIATGYWNLLPELNATRAGGRTSGARSKDRLCSGLALCSCPGADLVHQISEFSGEGPYAASPPMS